MRRANIQGYASDITRNATRQRTRSPARQRAIYRIVLGAQALPLPRFKSSKSS